MSKEGHDRAGEWCILRMSGPSTMRVVASLQDAGLEVWTPTEHVKRRIPRGKGSEHLIVPMAPTYAFARGRHLPDLQRITRMDVSPHPRFSIFRYYGETVFVRHAELHRLRAQQQRSYVKTLPKLRRHAGKPRGAAFDVGDLVAFESGPLTGLQCFVEASDGLNTTLSLSLFGRITKMNVATLQLRSHNVPEQKHAA